MPKYIKRDNKPVVAIQVNLGLAGFTYYKWGGTQRCKPCDWIVDNDGDVYSIDQETFASTYKQISPGQYIKDVPVWAVTATEAGKIETKEGFSDYEPGDYIVYNNQDGTDGYCVKPDKFTSMYKMEQS